MKTLRLFFFVLFSISCSLAFGQAQEVIIGQDSPVIISNNIVQGVFRVSPSSRIAAGSGGVVLVTEEEDGKVTRLQLIGNHMDIAFRLGERGYITSGFAILRFLNNGKTGIEAFNVKNIKHGVFDIDPDRYCVGINSDDRLGTIFRLSVSGSSVSTIADGFPAPHDQGRNEQVWMEKIVKVSPSRFLLGHREKGLVVWDNDKQELSRPDSLNENGLLNNQVHGFCKISADSVLIGGSFGVVLANPQTFKAYRRLEPNIRDLAAADEVSLNALHASGYMLKIGDFVYIGSRGRDGLVVYSTIKKQFVQSVGLPAGVKRLSFDSATNRIEVAGAFGGGFTGYITELELGEESGLPPAMPVIGEPSYTHHTDSLQTVEVSIDITLLQGDTLHTSASSSGDFLAAWSADSSFNFGFTTFAYDTVEVRAWAASENGAVSAVTKRRLYISDRDGNFSPPDEGPNEDPAETPESFVLRQNYPNPFNPGTAIMYGIPEGEAVSVQIKIYDLLGREVRTLVDELKEPGTYEASWDGMNAAGEVVAAGIYVYRLRAGSFSETRKMVLVR